jgi:hypothetical protein
MTNISNPGKLRAPINDAIIAAVARLVDDAQSDRRDPTHSALDSEINRAGLATGDPKSRGEVVGKAKRIRATLQWGVEHALDEAEVFLAAFVALLRGVGGFRRSSPNFCGEDAIAGAIDAFRAEGFVLTPEGELYAANLDSLAGAELTAALEAYVRRAIRGSGDAALVLGTGKDLLEATSAHVISEIYGSYPTEAHFPTLLGQAFTVLGLTTSAGAPRTGETAWCRLERALYDAGCSVNALRNRQGTGHGRPWLPTVSESEAQVAIQVIGVISGLLLAAHKAKTAGHSSVGQAPLK